MLSFCNGDPMKMPITDHDMGPAAGSQTGVEGLVPYDEVAGGYVRFSLRRELAAVILAALRRRKRLRVRAESDRALMAAVVAIVRSGQLEASLADNAREGGSVSVLSILSGLMSQRRSRALYFDPDGSAEEERLGAPDAQAAAEAALREEKEAVESALQADIAKAKLRAVRQDEALHYVRILTKLLGAVSVVFAIGGALSIALVLIYRNSLIKGAELPAGLSHSALFVVPAAVALLLGIIGGALVILDSSPRE
jgi:hypothetical protein